MSLCTGYSAHGCLATRLLRIVFGVCRYFGSGIHVFNVFFEVPVHVQGV